MTNQLREVIAFLLGETELDGVWFGEPHPSGKPYWWRDRLSKATLPSQSAGVEFVDVDAEIARIEASDGGRGKMAVARMWAKEALQNVSPAGVEERARELFAVELERADKYGVAESCRKGHKIGEFSDCIIRAIAAALRTPASEGDGGRTNND